MLYVVHVAPERDVDLFVTACASVMPLLPGWRAQIIGDVNIDVTHTETSFVHLVRGLAGASREIADGAARGPPRSAAWPGITYYAPPRLDWAGNG